MLTRRSPSRAAAAALTRTGSQAGSGPGFGRRDAQPHLGVGRDSPRTSAATRRRSARCACTGPPSITRSGRIPSRSQSLARGRPRSPDRHAPEPIARRAEVGGSSPSEGERLRADADHRRSGIHESFDVPERGERHAARRPAEVQQAVARAVRRRAIRPRRGGRSPARRARRSRSRSRPGHVRSSARIEQRRDRRLFADEDGDVDRGPPAD